jgi:hypothetical protein
MKTERLQRTLLVGVGRTGAQIAGVVKQQLARMLGQVGIYESIVVQLEETGAETDDLLTLRLQAETSFLDWQPDLEQLASTALRRISQLRHLTTLVQLGLTLNRPDEIHLIVAADLDEPWVRAALAGVVNSLGETVTQTLACQAGITGLFVSSKPTPTPAVLPGSRAGDPLEVKEKDYFETADSLPGAGGLPAAGLFDRGCFVASTTNEAGLVVGEPADLVQRVAHFLTLLVSSPLGGAIAEPARNPVEWIAGSEATVATFGLATATWPGEEICQILSRRWAKETLRQLVEPGAEISAKSGENWVASAREAAQQLVIAEGLTPPALLEELDRLISPRPDYLLEKIPDPPWPWLLAEVQASLEREIRQWETDWPAIRQTLASPLSTKAAAWSNLARQWLEQQLREASPGVLFQAKVYLAALSELLTVFVDGVEERLVEREGDLLAVEGQASQTVEALATHLAHLPGSPLAIVWQWGLHPRRWWQGWLRCRQAQTAARQLAQLWRQRLLVLQAIWLHEMLLPFYQTLRTEWRQIVETWVQYDQAVQQASQLTKLTQWPEQLITALGAARGPWSEDMVETLYQEALKNEWLSLTVVMRGCPNLPGLTYWVEAGVSVEEITQQFQHYAAGVLRPLIAMPVDRALTRQFPAAALLTDWLAAFTAQASPFWHYDEATLDETARSRVSLASWLFLPGAESSPLADLAQRLPQPPTLLDSLSPEELTAVTVRWGASVGKLWETDRQHKLNSDEGVEPYGF